MQLTVKLLVDILFFNKLFLFLFIIILIIPEASAIEIEYNTKYNDKIFYHHEMNPKILEINITFDEEVTNISTTFYDDIIKPKVLKFDQNPKKNIYFEVEIDKFYADKNIEMDIGYDINESHFKSQKILNLMYGQDFVIGFTDIPKKLDNKFKDLSIQVKIYTNLTNFELFISDVDGIEFKVEKFIKKEINNTTTFTFPIRYDPDNFIDIYDNGYPTLEIGLFAESNNHFLYYESTNFSFRVVKENNNNNNNNNLPKYIIFISSIVIIFCIILILLIKKK